jgi:hypothetical protein
MREVQRGVWHWEAPHPEWAGPENEALRQRLSAMAQPPNEAARGLVSCYAIDDGDRLMLVDPVVVPREIEELAAGREPVVVLTSPWHERDTRSFVERIDAPVFTPPPDEGSPDVAWSWAKRAATRTCTRPAIGCPSEWRRSPEGCPMTSCCGSRASVRSSLAIRSSTLARDSRSWSNGYPQT